MNKGPPKAGLCCLRRKAGASRACGSGGQSVARIVARQHEIEQDARHGGQADARQGEGAEIELHAAHAENDDQRHNHHIARLEQIMPGPHQRVQAHHHDGSEQKDHDAAHDRRGDAAQKGPHLGHKGKQNGADGRPGHDGGIEGPGQRHRAGHFGIGGIGRPAQGAGGHGGQTVAQHGVLDAGIAQEILARHRADGDNVAEMLNGRGHGHGNDEEQRLPGEPRHDETGHGEPRRGTHGLPVAHAQPHGRQQAHADAAENGNQPQQAASQQGNGHRGQQGRHGKRQGRGARHELLGTVAGQAQRHLYGHRRQHKADDHDHRAGDDGRQETQDDVCAAKANERAQGHIEQAGKDERPHGQRYAPGFCAVHDGRDEGEGRCQKDGNLAARHHLKDQGADSGGKEGHIAVETGQQGHQHQRAEGHKEHLRAEQGLPRTKDIATGIGIGGCCVHADFRTLLRPENAVARVVRAGTSAMPRNSPVSVDSRRKSPSLCRTSG